MASNFMHLTCKVVQFTHRKKYLLVTLSFVHGVKGNGAMSPSSASINGLINAYKASLGVQMAHYFIQLCAKLGTLHMEMNYLLAILSFLCGTEGDGATLLSFAAKNGTIDASSSSLDAPIATHHM